MFNEILFIGAVLVNLTIIVGAVRYGRVALILASGVNLILVAVFAPKLVTTFGLLSNVGNIFYGSLFLSTNLLIERYGKARGYEAIWIIFSGYVLFITMAQFTLRFAGDAQSAIANDAISSLFATAPRIALASIIAFIAVQYFNVWFYSFVKERTAGKRLWLRHISSTTLSQLFDSVLFFSIAFFGLIPGAVLFEAMAAGFILKTLIGFIATPFMYLGAAIGSSDSSNANQN